MKAFDTELFFWLLAFLGLLIGLFLIWWMVNRRASILLERVGASEFDDLPPSQWLVLQENPLVKIHYVQWGKGPDILLIHGIGASVYCWRFLGPLLSKKYRVTAIDLPGFGLSTKPIGWDYGLEGQAERLVEIIKSLELCPELVVGSSMGGLLALYLQVTRPKSILKTVTLAPALHRYLVPFPIDSFAKIAPLLQKRIKEKTMTALLKRVVHNTALATPQAIQNYLKPYESDPAASVTFTKALKTIRSPKNPNFLKNLSSPALILHGDQDRIVSVKISQKSQRLSPLIQLQTLSQAGHHLQEDNPIWVAQQIFQFMQNSKR